MLVWLSRRVVKNAWYVVGTWAVLAVTLLVVSFGGLGGTALFDRLEAGDPEVSGTQSAQGEQILRTLAGDSQTVSLLVPGVDISATGSPPRWPRRMPICGPWWASRMCSTPSSSPACSPSPRRRPWRPPTWMASS